MSCVCASFSVSTAYFSFLNAELYRLSLSLLGIVHRLEACVLTIIAIIVFDHFGACHVCDQRARWMASGVFLWLTNLCGLQVLLYA